MALTLPTHGATGWDSILNPILTDHENRITTVEPLVTAATAAATAATTAANNAAQNFAVFAAAGTTTAAVGNIYIANTAGGAFAITLPVTPTDKSRIKVMWGSGGSTLTVNAGGSAKFNSTSGATSETFLVLNEVHTYTYATAGYWTVEVTAPLSALDSRYAPAGASYKGIAFSTGEVVTTGYDLVPNGLPIVANATMTAVQLMLNYPTIGGSQTWKVVLDHSGSFSTVATITIADGARGGVTNSLSVALVPGDLLLVQCTAANGSTYAGLGPAFRAAFGGSLALPTAPSAITGLAATGAPTSVALTWTMGTGSISNLVRRDGAPYAVTAVGSYTDNGPTGAGLSAGETHTYNVDALVPGNIAIGSSGVTGGTASSYSYYPSVAQAVSALSADFTVTLGSNTGTAAAIDASGIATFTSGNVGSAAAQDIVNTQWIKDTTTHSAWDRAWQFNFGTTNALVNMYFSANTWPGLGVSNTNFIQFEFSPTVYRLGIKAAGYTPPSQSAGSFYNTTTTAAAQATNPSASGSVNWPITVTADGAHWYGVRVTCGLIKGDGTQDIKVYMGTVAQFGTNGAGLPLVNTITLTATQRSAIAFGKHYWDQLGQQTATTPISQIYKEQTVTIIPLSASGA